MRRGWSGTPPRDDKEARARILAATLHCVYRHGVAKTGISDVATELGITRQTVYRHYASLEDLLLALGSEIATSFIQRIATHLTGIDDPAAALVEGIAYCVEHLPHEPVLGELLTSDNPNQLLAHMTGPLAVERVLPLLQKSEINWTRWGYDDTALTELIRYSLRVVQSLIFNPPHEGTDPERVRALLERWVAPAVRAAGPPAR